MPLTRGLHTEVLIPPSRDLYGFARFTILILVRDIFTVNATCD